MAKVVMMKLVRVWRDRGPGRHWRCAASQAAHGLALLMVAGLLLQGGVAAVSADDPPKDDGEPSPGKDVVVVLPDNVDADQVLTDLGIDPTYQYDEVVNGFAANVSAADKQELKSIPGAIVSPNRPIEAFDNNKGHGKDKAHGKDKSHAKDNGPGKVKDQGKHKHKHGHKKHKKHKNTSQPSQTQGLGPQQIPTGISRVGVTQNPQAAIAGDGGATDVDVAVLDTGIGPNSDLTIAGGQDCVGAGTTDDGNGHGTHVSGTIGALDDTAGVVGVAPGARLFAVKVLDDSGSGDDSTVICGLEWVVAHADTIDVVNMSLGGPDPLGGSDCANSALHQAVCNVVNAGIPVIVAAGNESTDASSSSPGNYDQVITVSALSDFNGTAGGGASSTCENDVDDSFADYSNFGSVVDIMAPGTCILSTVPGDALDTFSGTSMATPHVTGAAALFLASHPSATPADVKSYLTGASGSVAQGTPNGLATSDDPGAEPVLFIPNAAP